MAYSIVNRLFYKESYADKGLPQSLKNLLLAENQYQSIREYSAAYHPPQAESDSDYGGWENAKRLAAAVMVALEDNVPDFAANIDIGTVVVVDTGASKEEVCDTIGSQSDSCGKEIDNPIGDRLNFYAVDGGYVAKDGEIIIYTDGEKERGGHVFHGG